MKKVFFLIIALAQFIIVNAQSSGGHDYVDLGLSVKWATCNVGAGSITEPGSLFKWGETTYTATNDWSSYKYAEAKNGKVKKILKYKNNGWRSDKMTQLELSDDAAAVNWGDGWRMPTKDEAEELIYNCTWSWVNFYGIHCVEAKSKRNGKCIYFPIPSYEPGSAGGDAYREACYWTSSLDPSSEESYSAFFLFVDYGGNPQPDTNGKLRAYRLSVRPVRK